MKKEYSMFKKKMKSLPDENKKVKELNNQQYESNIKLQIFYINVFAKKKNENIYPLHS